MSLSLPRRAELGRAEGLGFCLLALTVGYLVNTAPVLAGVVALIPLLLFLFLRPDLAIAAMVISLPLVKNLVGNDYGSLNFGTSDVLAAVGFLGLAVLVLLSSEWRDRLRAARPMLIWCLPFLAWLVILMFAHASVHVGLNTAQDVQLTAVALIFGATLITRRVAPVAMWGFVACSTLLAIIWLLTRGHNSFAGNKNTAGQFIAYSVLLVFALQIRWWLRAPLVLLLVGGLFYAASRGAIVGMACGAIALLAVRGLGSWKRTAGAVLTLLSALVIGYNVLPTNLQAHVQSIAHGGASDVPEHSRAAAPDTGLAGLKYNVDIRTAYRRDGLALARSHPLLGVGVGNYHTGTGATEAIDPHNVLVRNAAEGGYLEDVFFIVMVLGTVYVAARRLGRNPWAGPAIALQVAMITHSLLDIYWVRALPVLPWVLLGMSVNPALDRSDD